MASRIASRGASAISIWRFRMNRSLSNVSKSIGSLTMTVSLPSLSESGNSDVLARDRLGHQFDDRGRDDDFGQIDVVEAVLLGHRPHHVFAGGIAQSDQGVGQFHARFAGPSAGLRPTGRG